MKNHPTLRRYLSLLATSTFVTAMLIVLACSRQPSPSPNQLRRTPPGAADGEAGAHEDQKASADNKVAVRLEVPPRQWPMFRSSPSRNRGDPDDNDRPKER